MARPPVILLGALVLGAAIFAGSYYASQRVALRCCTQPADDLNWLRIEFHLSDAEMARVRKLHDDYLPQCAEMCAQIARVKSEIASTSDGGTQPATGMKAKLDELAALRARCQAQMLQHFVAVSQTMPPDQGRRYLAEMKRITLGDDGQMEQSMSDGRGHEHQP